MKNFEKFTEKKWDEMLDKGKDPKNLLKENVAIKIYDNTCNYEFGLLTSLVDCESPIEQLLAMEMFEHGIETICLYNPFIEVIAIDKQHEINVENKKYRVDFFIPVEYYKKTKDGFEVQKHVNFIVEADGHEFHQKTKEQVERDNERNRTLQRNGYEVIHFSGTEIYHKTHQCVSEIRKAILSKCDYEVSNE